MLNVFVCLQGAPTDSPAVILVHGAANSAAVWTFWQRELAARGWSSYAIDLRGHGRSDPVDLSRVTMRDYADDVQALARQLVRPPIVIGWSMGGLVAMMVAAAGHAIACLGLAPSLPAQQIDTQIAIRSGEFGPEEYGIISNDPEHQPTMPDLNAEELRIALASVGRESRFARDERKAGIVVQTLACPLLIVTGSADTVWPAERYDSLWLAADRLIVQARHTGGWC
jgi:pimeloyl-ACP methyl ester carboxylesterase